MKEKDVIAKGPKKRDPTSLQVQHALIIPAGTILRQDPGKPGTFTCPLAYGSFSVDREAAEQHPDSYKKVVAA